MMYSVMLVDNEPIIPKGLMKLIDWRSCDCQMQSVRSGNKRLTY